MSTRDFFYSRKGKGEEGISLFGRLDEALPVFVARDTHGIGKSNRSLTYLVADDESEDDFFFISSFSGGAGGNSIYISKILVFVRSCIPIHSGGPNII